MKKFFLILSLVFVFLLFPYNAFAVSINGSTFFYLDDQGVQQSNSNATTGNWNGIPVLYVNYGFSPGNFSTFPVSNYFFLPSNLGCTGSSCNVTGTYLSYTNFGADGLQDIKVELEVAGTYHSCSITNSAIVDTYFQYYNFSCFAPNVNRGFNLVFSNMELPVPGKTIYFGLGYDTIQINENVGWGDIISNNNNNTNKLADIITNLNNAMNDSFTNVMSNINQNTVNLANTITNNQNANQQQTNQKLDNLNNSINDDTTDNNYQNSTLNTLNGQMASNNVISDLLLLPVSMYQKIVNSLGSNSCTAYSLGSLYGTNLTLPCITVSNYIGSELWTVIDLIFCGMFVLVIRKKFVDIFNNMTNLKDRGNDIE